jgi:serine/threonine-protein kinase
MDQIGPYTILKNLGKGGMGEVYLVTDPRLDRQVALKQIRPDLKDNPTIRSRFLREAKIAASLSHPSIIPIFEIDPNGDYYTMPFVEGETLRQILKTSRDEEKKGGVEHPIGASIPALARIFLSVCEAVAYTHARRILHRDLKPENVMVGRFGEVRLLDWGIADKMDEAEELSPIGKIAGTLTYLAPERIKTKHSTIETDIYSLGVMLYQILTLQLPFQRKDVAKAKKLAGTEAIVDPIEAAPYREIPKGLAAAAMRCLSPSASDRYERVELLIEEVKNYLEGKPEWVVSCRLDPKKRGDWLLEEHLHLGAKSAISQRLDDSAWATVKVSAQAFGENVRIRALFKLKEGSRGLGILLSIDPKQLDEGYSIWVEKERVRLFRNQVEAIGAFIATAKTICLQVEKKEDQIRVLISGKELFTFKSHLPLAGQHVGLLTKDTLFEFESLEISEGSRDALVSCLSVPNALFVHKLYPEALSEYRRIGRSLPGRAEGREALFRAGLTLLYKGQANQEQSYFQSALKEFEKLSKTSGAPLEYLGKSLVYEQLNEIEEEAKCLELALRKFPNHPLRSHLKEQIALRMHESASTNREAAYRIILLMLRLVPDLLEVGDNRQLLKKLQEGMEPLPFVKVKSLDTLKIALAFWLGKKELLREMAESFKKPLLDDIAICMAELDGKPPEPSEDPRELLRYLFVHVEEAPRYRDVEWEDPRYFDALDLFAALLAKKKKEALEILKRHPQKNWCDERSPLHFAYGTALFILEGRDAAFRHFQRVLETQNPPTTALPSLFLTKNLKESWMKRAFFYEKKELHRQVELFQRITKKR